MNINDGDLVAVVDLELVASEGSLASRWHRSQDFPEIIEIGALLLRFKDGIFIRENSLLCVVKPTLHSELPKYILDLTCKSQEYFNDGLSLIDGIKELNLFCNTSKFILANGVDGEILEYNRIKFNLDIEIPIIRNIQEYLRGVHQKFPGNTHSALDDCELVAKKLDVCSVNQKKIRITETTYSPLVKELVLNHDKDT